MPGNHDAALAESVWTQSQRLDLVAENVHLALTAESIELPEAGLVVLPAPLTQRQTYKDLTAWFDDAETPENLIRVGLAHGSTEGELHDEIDAKNPIARDRAQTARLDYLALGDWHGLKEIDPRTWYSGTPEPERFKDNNPGHALLVEISATGQVPKVTPLPTAEYHWFQWDRQLEVDTDIDVLIDKLEGLPAGQVLDVTLSGSVTLSGQARITEALAAVEGRQRSLRSHLDDPELYEE